MKHTITPDKLLDTLTHVGISFELHGALPSGRLAFASLRQPISNAIYFFEGDSFNLPALDNLLVLAKQPLPAVATLVVAAPQEAFYRLMQHLFTPSRQAFIHPTAVVSDKARLGKEVAIGAYCVVGEADISDGCQIGSHVVIHDQVSIGKNVRIESHTVLGATGVAWLWGQNGERIMQPQIGSLSIGDDCFIGSHVTLVRGSVNENTEVGSGTLISHGSNIGHGVRIGKLSHLANKVALAGNVTLGERCFLGAGCTLRSRVTLADNTIVGAGASVLRDWHKSGYVLQTQPARPFPQDQVLTGVPKSQANEKPEQDG